MKIWIGTSGFQYPEWKGKFYPEKIPAARMLAFYSERFGTTEVNYTFRRIPSAKTILAWKAATPAGFKFSFKAPQRVTHFAKLRGCAELLGVFQGAISEAGEKCGAVLFQLPPTFRKDAHLLRDFLNELPQGMRAAFEFRHASWMDDETFEILSSATAALCVAESETLATPAVATADYGYLRLRREDYTAAKIAHWAEWVEGQRPRWSEVFIYFKHEERAVGPQFAKRMQDQLTR